jgi:hypothetical protein
MGKETNMRARHLWIAAAALVLASPAFALDSVIQSGIDLWQTKGDGTTYAKFDKNPIPAGFFCPKSERFTGRIVFQGDPIVTANPKALRNADTIVHRLDDAVFNKRGVATTRIQLRAMTFQSVAPLQTACGAFNASLKLDGEQPITRMRIIRENEKGGRFAAPIWANVKVTFTPVGRQTSELFEIPIKVRFPPLRNQRWASPPAGLQSIASPAFVTVDTDGDRVADTSIPGTSNFLVGFSGLRSAPRPLSVNADTNIYAPQACGVYMEQDPSCHPDDCGVHCPTGLCPY